MPSQSENLADRDARLEKAALNLEKAVALLQQWRAADDWAGARSGVGEPLRRATLEFLESLT